jgi:orotidine-5'-phosphate decarboxylase
MSIVQIIQAAQSGGGVAASTAQARRMRYVLLEFDPHIRLAFDLGEKQARGSDDEVVIIRRQRRIVARELEATIALDRDRQFIAQRNRRHQRFDFMESVVAPAQDSKGKIDLRRSGKLHKIRSCRRNAMHPQEPSGPREKLIVALDVPTRADAVELVRQLSPHVGFFKVGLQLFVAEGPDVVKAVRDAGGRVFLDLKLHDIPQTVARAIESAARLGAEMLTIHLTGGREMIEAACAVCPKEILLLGVSVLTSASWETLRGVGVGSSVEEQVLRLARLGIDAGVGGVVASPHEVAAIRRLGVATLKIVTPGVRPAGADVGDQQRVMTPSAAIAAGADFLVIGRPIIADVSPRDAAARILDEINGR